MYVNALANGIAAGGKPADMFLLTVTMSKLHADVPYEEKVLQICHSAQA